MKVAIHKRFGSRLLDLYMKRANGFHFNVTAPAAVSCSAAVVPILTTDYIPRIAAVVLGTLLIGSHSYLMRAVKDRMTRTAEHSRTQIRRYAWLMAVIRTRISEKTTIFLKQTDIPAGYRRTSIWRNLQVLYEFYRRYEEGETPTRIRVSFFTPAEANDYLECQFWYYGDGQRPHFTNNHNQQQARFSRAGSRSLVVKAWNSMKTEVWENSSEIDYHYQGQDQYIRSMLAYPIKGIDGSDFVGVICLCADRENFFMRRDIQSHDEFISECAARLLMEWAAYRRSQK